MTLVANPESDNAKHGYKLIEYASRKRAKTESEAGHLMDSREKKLYYFIQLELLRLKNLTKIFGEEQSPRY